MKDISLKDLLEAGCHFGHKVEKWHPKAASFIFGEREHIHIIDLAKTRAGLKKAAEFVRDLGKEGKLLLLVATKRQAKGVVAEAAKRAGCPYLTTRWIGGFITNWGEVRKNIDKLKNFRQEHKDGSWKKFPKHEEVELAKTLRKLETVYGGVSQLDKLPEALFIVDLKKEVSCLREAVRLETTTVAMVDTNVDPNLVDYPICANDDAVGSIRYVTNYLADAYIEGKKIGEKASKVERDKEEKKEEKALKMQSGEEAKEQRSKEEKKQRGKEVKIIDEKGEEVKEEKPKKKRVEKEEKKEKEKRGKEEKEKRAREAKIVDKEKEEVREAEPKKKPLDKARGKRRRPKKVSSS